MLLKSLSSFRFFKPKPTHLKFFLAPTLTFSAVYCQKNFFSTSELAKDQPTPEPSPPVDIDYTLVINSDLQEGEMREVQVGPNKEDIVLVCKIDGKHYCVQSKCPHVGAPLGKGLLFDDKVLCPFHNAGFSVITGYPEMGPVFNGLAKYEITETGGKLTIKVPKNKLNVSETVPMSTRNPNDHRRYVIVGGGAAALSCAETLRQSGFEGEIVMVAEENTVPYDRTMLSKWIFGSSLEKLLLRQEPFYKKYDINVHKGTHVSHIDYDSNVIYTNDFNRIHYDKLLLATGGSPRKPNVPGVNLENVLVLRSIEDQAKIQNLVNSGKVNNIVIIGASFIGMETASALKKELKDKINITVVDFFKTPFERVLGTQIGSALSDLHKSNGVNFVLEKGLKSLNGTKQIESATLSDGTILQADLVLLGTGISPNISLAKGQLEISKTNGGIETDVFLRTNKKNVFAAGDVASFPYWVNGGHVRIEHYNEAIHQGSLAAFNMLDKHVPLDGVSFFWTKQWDKTLQYSGFAEKYDEVFIDGDLKTLNFAAFYLKDDKVLAVAAMNRPNLALLINEAMKLNIMPRASDVKAGKFDVQELKKKVLAMKPASRCKKANCCRNK